MTTYDPLFAALSDPTRRTVLETLRAGPRSVGEVASALPVSQPAVSQHLRVLREAGLVRWSREGARHIYRISPDGMVALRAYVESFWSDVLTAFQAEASDQSKGEPGE